MSGQMNSSAGGQGQKDAAQMAAASEKGEGVTILLVEDDADTLRVMTRLLTKNGHAVTTADSFAAAREKLSKTNYTLLISDIGLPDGNGLDLFALIEGKPTAGIVLSGYTDDADLVKSANAGFARHLTKPIDFTELEKAIGELVGGRQ